MVEERTRNGNYGNLLKLVFEKFMKSDLTKIVHQIQLKNCKRNREMDEKRRLMSKGCARNDKLCWVPKTKINRSPDINNNKNVA